MTLEAAMVLPFFMLFIVFLAMIIRLAIVDMALYQSLAETNEVVVTLAYPADLATTAVSNIVEEKFDGLSEKFEIDPQLAKDLLNDSMEYLGINIDVNGYLDSITPGLVEPIIEDKFSSRLGGNFFDPTNLKIDSIKTPTSFTGDGAFLEINASYDVDISIPFVEKTITLKKTSYERLWAGA